MEPPKPAPQPALADAFGLRIEACNGTSWEGLKVELCRTEANVVLASEHHLLAAAVPEASAWAAARGWKSLWSPATSGARARDSQGGTAIFARDYLGLRPPEDLVRSSESPGCLVRGRVTAGVLDSPGLRGISLYSVYLWCKQGLSEANCSILEKVGLHASSRGGQFVIGGDFNVTPQYLEHFGFAKQLGATTI